MVTYREGTQPQRIYAFVKGGGELYVNSLWGRWATSTNPVIPSRSSPGVVTYRPDGGPQRIYAFLTEYRSDGDGIALKWWDGSSWQWHDQRTPRFDFDIDLNSSPGAVTYSTDKKSQRIFSFVTGNGDLYVNYFDGARWSWADHAQPGFVSYLKGSPGVITYRESSRFGALFRFGPQWIYAFITGKTGVWDRILVRPLLPQSPTPGQSSDLGRLRLAVA